MWSRWIGIAGTALGLLLAVALPASAQTVSIAVEASDLAPVHETAGGRFRGFARQLLDWFAVDNGLVLRYRVMPLNRAARLMSLGAIDLKYPDNRLWNQSEKLRAVVVYSRPFTGVTGGIFVRREALGRSRAAIRTLGILVGYTPVGFADRLASGRTELVYETRLEDLMRKTADGLLDGFYASVEPTEAIVAAQTLWVGRLAFDPMLPNAFLGFSLSSVVRPELIMRFDAWLAANATRIDRLAASRGLAEQQRVDVR